MEEGNKERQTETEREKEPESQNDQKDVILEDKAVDYILLGTSLTNSILAAALARAGRKIIHIDSLDTYGSVDRSLNYKEFKQFLNDHKTNFDDLSISLNLNSEAEAKQLNDYKSLLLRDNDNHNNELNIIPLSKTNQLAFHSAKSFYPNEDANNNSMENNFLISKNRNFSLDIQPRLIYSRGDFINTLILSNINNYIDFKAVDPLFVYKSHYVQTTYNDNKKKNNDNSNTGPESIGEGEGIRSSNFYPIPISKSEVFKSENSFLSLENKSRLMKLVYIILSEPRYKVLYQDECNNIDGWNEKPFHLFLKENYDNISFQIVNLLLYAIALLPFNQEIKMNGEDKSNLDDPHYHSHPLLNVSTKQARNQIKSFLSSVGRYGSGCFLYSLYGNGELASAFSRLAAVRNGIYILRFKPVALVQNLSENGKIAGIITHNKQFIKIDRALISEKEYLPKSFTCKPPSSPPPIHAFRFILLLSKPILGTEAPSVIVFPPGSVYSNMHPIRLIQLDDNMNTVPSGMVVVYGMTIRHANVQDEIDRFVQEVSIKKDSEESKPSHNENSSFRSQLVNEVSSVFSATATNLMHTTNMIAATAASSAPTIVPNDRNNNLFTSESSISKPDLRPILYHYSVYQHELPSTASGYSESPMVPSLFITDGLTHSMGLDENVQVAQELFKQLEPSLQWEQVMKNEDLQNLSNNDPIDQLDLQLLLEQNDNNNKKNDMNNSNHVDYSRNIENEDKDKQDDAFDALDNL